MNGFWNRSSARALQLILENFLQQILVNFLQHFSSKLSLQQIPGNFQQRILGNVLQQILGKFLYNKFQETSNNEFWFQLATICISFHKMFLRSYNHVMWTV